MKDPLKNFLKPILFSCLLFSLSFCFLGLLPREALAVDASTPTWTIPIPQIPIPTVNITQDSIKCSGNTCDIPWIGEYLAGIYKYAIGIVGIAAAIMLMVGGIRWLTAGGNASAVTDAQSYITGSLTGLVLALLSYTILYTINPALVSFKPIRVTLVQNIPISGGGGNCTWMSATQCNPEYGYSTGSSCPDRPECAIGPDGNVPPNCDTTQVCCCTTPAQSGCSWSNDPTCGNNTQQWSDYSKCGTYFSGGNTCCCDWSSANGLSQEEASQKLSNCGVNPGSVKLDGLQTSTIQDICSLRQYSGCNINITSGTGGTGHQTGECSHYTGCKLDFSLDSCVSGYLSNYLDCGIRSDGAHMYQAPGNGGCYAKEGTHWDLTIRKCSTQGGNNAPGC